MNALVASVIRTIVPVAVGQVASWLLLAHVVLPAAALSGLSTFLGGALTAIYYVAVRVLEQQWPAVGILLGLPSSPDTYSRSNATAAEPAAPAPSIPESTPGTVNWLPAAPDSAGPVTIEHAVPSAAAGAGFQSKVEAAISGTPAPETAPPIAPAGPVDVPFQA